ncbi:MAG TPA: hypothetical protein DEP43_08345, partial [Ruminococcaceae bacterium]|nr:hypothetical protein [Oscillospiraceae bacterium]
SQLSYAPTSYRFSATCFIISDLFYFVNYKSEKHGDICLSFGKSSLIRFRRHTICPEPFLKD